MELRPSPAESGIKQRQRIAVIDDDDGYRESLGLKLAVWGFEFAGFGYIEGALEYFSSGENASAVLLEWRTPAIDGAEALQGLRQRGVTSPIIFLTMAIDQNSEDAALKLGAVDFIDKTRRPSIVLKRLLLITQNAGCRPPEGLMPHEVRQGPLLLVASLRRAYWKRIQVELTRTEFSILHMLASQPDADITYRDIYDVVRGKDFMAGKGPNGYRTNVRSFIKRIRRKFRDVDPGFDCIKNYFGFGYRWHCPPIGASSQPARAVSAAESRALSLPLRPRLSLPRASRASYLANKPGIDDEPRRPVLGA